MGRLVWSVLLLGVGVLGQIPPPNRGLWYVSLAATEWGVWLLIPVLLIWFPGWDRTTVGKWGAALALVAAVLFLTPLWKARSYAKLIEAETPRLVNGAAPAQNAQAPARSAPFVPLDLIRGVGIPSIDWNSQPYKKVGERELELDLYYPPAGAPRIGAYPAPPLIIVLHGELMGGPWESGSRQEMIAFNRYLAAHGYVVASVDYRLAAEAPYPAAFEDVQEAIRSLQTRATSTTYDPARIVLIGRGGGAHLALLTSYMSRDRSIRGVVALYPPTDLLAWYQSPGKTAVAPAQFWLQQFMGAAPAGRGAGMYDAASPIRYVGAAPPTLLIHGARDPIVPVSQSERLAQSLREAQRDVFSFQLPWATHSCDTNVHGPCGQASTYLIERFLARVLR